ncbi:TPA: 50S ribosomal protein L6 [Campylobacter fetus subsp. venerealis]|uniref:Large ribosomal subunit protein uL6 n=2 Tax=Campylobacter fetus TaxID=196 RepID=A0AAE6IX38_CAMFE|nr:50S ribosomal protein L6 [Campylobacter fetus]OCS22473.1 50S ribosomal protein L6 [Campylobacter fetus subsp. venerealis cfvi97/532]OCS26471.1 50S ribosomal protein L6 [Campylobacter fetus subsp. venerealis cfvB10]OCS29868.1 50S ribosomal protein L6 [Campylobacter fetus subsp. venerealis LMG 6570 = CCUG 33900]OCS42951.1 50S ribosomal protein L6 [Campylobacter fetus subsp. venerealis cfvi02/298]AHE93402.1 50S ribosomal protein L6 [Campylobacter fetus subsp. venerealis cfvi03/293]
MSRIGKQPISIPNGLDVSLKGSVLVFKKGNNTKELDTKGNVNIEVKDGNIIFTSKGDDRQSRAYWGTYRALANNVVVGLTTGFTKQLEINGVGYKAAAKGKVLELALGFSHPINYELPEGIEISVEKNIITIKGSDKQVVGQVAAEVRGFRPPEPYKGKGVKYVEERIIRKAGKTSKK